MVRVPLVSERVTDRGDGMLMGRTTYKSEM
jgi:hypothetical protein